MGERQQLALTVISKSPLPLLASWTDAVSIDDGFLVSGVCQSDDVGSFIVSDIVQNANVIVLAQTSHIMGNPVSVTKKCKGAATLLHKFSVQYIEIFF